MRYLRVVGTAPWFATFFQAFVVLLACAPASTAQAEIVQFWVDSEKPSLTGRAPAVSLKARAARREASGDDDRPARTSKKRLTRFAALGNDAELSRPARNSVTGGRVSWSASSGCLNGTLSGLVAEVAANYGAVTVTSTCRSHGRNAAVGGAKRSHHLTGDAVDFRVHGNVSGTLAFLRSNGSVGGIHHYGGGLIHIDTGPRRTW